MPACVVCRSRFYNRGFMSEAEPCDCGACLTQGQWNDLDPDQQARLMAPTCSRCGQDTPIDGGCRTCYERDYCESPRLSETGQF